MWVSLAKLSKWINILNKNNKLCNTITLTNKTVQTIWYNNKIVRIILKYIINSYTKVIIKTNKIKNITNYSNNNVNQCKRLRNK